jgi:Bacterial toxin 47
MGAPDQTLDKDAHASIHDDGRILRPVQEDEYLLEYDEAGYPSGKMDLPSYARQAFLFRGNELIPETVYVHGENFTATEWEAEYSNLMGSGDEQTFTPVINDTYRVVGHFGWIGGHNICVPRNTIADYSPSAVDFQQARLREWQRRRVWSQNHPLPRLPGQSVSAAPTKRPDICWPANKPPAITLRKPEDEEALWKSLLEATPGQDPSEELRIRENMNFFLAGGGTAIVGRRFGWYLVPSERWDGRVAPYDTYLMLPYRCLVLVGPDGHIQEMLRVEWAPPESRNEKILRVALEVIDLALTIWMIIDIATIPVALFRLTGELVARQALVQAVRLHEDLELKAVLEGAAREAAAKASGNAAKELRGVTSQLKPAMEEEFGAGARREVSAIDRGRGARPFYGTSRNRPAAGWTFNPKVDAYVATHDEAIAEAFRRTGVPMNEFEATKVAKTAEGKTITVEWTVKKGPNRGAQVNIDDPRIVPAMNGPQAPHVGYRTAKGEVVGHIFPKEGVLASRSRIQRP